MIFSIFSFWQTIQFLWMQTSYFAAFLSFTLLKLIGHFFTLLKLCFVLFRCTFSDASFLLGYCLNCNFYLLFVVVWVTVLLFTSVCNIVFGSLASTSIFKLNTLMHKWTLLHKKYSKRSSRIFLPFLSTFSLFRCCCCLISIYLLFVCAEAMQQKKCTYFKCFTNKNC